MNFAMVESESSGSSSSIRDVARRQHRDVHSFRGATVSRAQNGQTERFVKRQRLVERRDGNPEMVDLQLW